jgi:hypothetical protein
MRTGSTPAKVEPAKTALVGYDNSGATIKQRWNVYCGAQPKTRARSERCEGGCRSDDELREVGTEMICSIARSSP